jgi:hypothetical protein
MHSDAGSGTCSRKLASKCIEWNRSAPALASRLASTSRLAQRSRRAARTNGLVRSGAPVDHQDLVALVIDDLDTSAAARRARREADRRADDALATHQEQQLNGRKGEVRALHIRQDFVGSSTAGADPSAEAAMDPSTCAPIAASPKTPVQRTTLQPLILYRSGYAKAARPHKGSSCAFPSHDGSGRRCTS